jgi:hypothetical protein
MGEIYEVVIFTASLSKVDNIISVTLPSANLVDSMPTRFLISLIFIKWLHIGYSERAVTATRETMSR